MLDGILDGASDQSEHLPVPLDEHQHRWQGRSPYLCADSGSSAGRFVNRLEGGAFSRWSVSYNKWTDTLDPLAGSKHDWRIRVGDYRVVYEIADQIRIVRVNRVRHRREVYR